MKTRRLRRERVGILEWKCLGVIGSHHSHYALYLVRAVKLPRGKVEVRVFIEEEDDGESIPNKNSRRNMDRIFDKILIENAFDSVKIDAKGVTLQFALANGSGFIEQTIKVFVHIFKLLEVRTYPPPKNLRYRQVVRVEMSPGEWVTEEEWLLRLAQEAIK